MRTSNPLNQVKNTHMKRLSGMVTKDGELLGEGKAVGIRIIVKTVTGEEAHYVGTKTVGIRWRYILLAQSKKER